MKDSVPTTRWKLSARFVRLLLAGIDPMPNLSWLQAWPVARSPDCVASAKVEPAESSGACLGPPAYSRPQATQ
jgi:hypothetical protein